MIIDSNTHPTLNGLWLERRDGVTFEQVSNILRINNIDFGLAIGLPGVGGYEHAEYWAECQKFANLIPVAAVTSRIKSELEKELSSIKEIGYKSIKFHPRLLNPENLPDFTSTLFQIAARLNLTLFVCGYVYKDIKSFTIELADFHRSILINIQRNPNVKVVYLHGGIHSSLEMLMWARHSENLLIDFSNSFQYRYSYLKDEVKFMVERLDMRITLGSDFPDLQYQLYMNAIEELGTQEKSKIKNILGVNIAKFLKLN